MGGEDREYQIYSELSDMNGTLALIADALEVMAGEARERLLERQQELQWGVDIAEDFSRPKKQARLDAFLRRNPWLKDTPTGQGE